MTGDDITPKTHKKFGSTASVMEHDQRTLIVNKKKKSRHFESSIMSQMNHSSITAMN